MDTESLETAKPSRLMIHLKQCSKCGRTLPLQEFRGGWGYRDGLRGDCVDCLKLGAHQHYERNRERLLAKSKVWREANREHHYATIREWKQMRAAVHATQNIKGVTDNERKQKA